jgi:hypothetical protein
MHGFVPPSSLDDLPVKASYLAVERAQLVNHHDEHGACARRQIRGSGSSTKVINFKAFSRPLVPMMPKLSQMAAQRIDMI